MKTYLTILFCFFVGICFCQNLKESDLLGFISNNSEAKISQIYQMGDYNKAEINAQQINLKQIGINQEFLYINPENIPSNISVEMNGEHNYLEILGQNQLSENLEITVEGSYRDIIIRNYP